MSEKRKCCVCSNYLDTLFEQARPNVLICSNKCRQKRYRDRKRNAEYGVTESEKEFASHEIDEARLRRIKCFVDDCVRGLNPYQVPRIKSARGLHATPNPCVIGIDT